MTVKSAILSVLVIPIVGWGQETSTVSAPAMGYVFDSGMNAFRPLLGMPGAALVGAPLDSDMPLAAAAMSPRQDYALVLTDGDRQVRLTRFQDGKITLSDISLPADPDRVLLSPMGSAAALFYSTTGILQVLGGLPDAPRTNHKIGVSNLGRISSMAISDNGRFILVANDSGGVLLFDGAAGPIQLPIAGPVSAMAFRSGSDDAVISNQDGRISLIRALSQQAKSEILVDATNGLADAIAMEFSADGSRVYGVSADGTIIGLSITERTSVLLSCHCKASGLYRLNGGTAFRLNDATERPLWLLEVSTNPERVLFVPQDRIGSAVAANDSTRSVQ